MSDDVVGYEYELRGTVGGYDDWHTTLAYDHPEDAIAPVETLEYRNVRELTYRDDHRPDGALPDDQPAPPPWADDDGGGDGA